MSIPDNQDNFSYVLPGGEITLQALFQTYAWSGIEQPVSSVQLTIAPVGGGAPVVTTSDVVTVDQATYSYQWLPAPSLAPGDYVVEWTATGGQPITYVVTVVALPQETPSIGVYATVAQYQAWAMDMLTPTDLVTMYLRRASEIIDEALIGAVYPVDADSMPTNASHIDLFMRATCAQTQFMIANADPANVKPQYASTSMGGVSQTRTASAQGGVLPRLAPQAAAILHTGGALSVAPLIAW